MHKKKEVVQDVSLHDIDMANARPQVLRGRGGGGEDERIEGRK